MSSPAADALAVAPGDILAGKYRVERVLGAGGMGVVVAALHLELDERVAVKFLLPEVSRDSSAAARFIREARAAARIKSEHVARVIDVGRLETGAPYMVMEYLEGSDLESIVSQGALPIEDAVDYIIQACHAMAEAHGVGIVHRDLKPANLFVCQRPDGTRGVKVLDFGISKTSEAGDVSLTRTSTMMGSPLYMSPEQMRSARDVDRRTDIWALGAILYQLFSGRTPFHGETLPELITRILTDDPVPLSTLRPELPRELEAIVLRCLRKTPSARFDNVGELVQALSPFGSRRSRYTAERVAISFGTEPSAAVSQAPRTPQLKATLGVGGQTATAWAETSDQAARHLSRRKWLIAGGALGGVGLALLFALPMLRSETQAAPPRAASSASAQDGSAAGGALVSPRLAEPVVLPGKSALPMPVGAPTLEIATANSGTALAAAPQLQATQPAPGPAERKSTIANPSRSNAAKQPPSSVAASLTASPPASPAATPAEPVAPKREAPSEPAPKRNPLAIELK